MATYNGERYIREQLESIARQTLLPLELVVTDDGSTDTTLEIVDDFAGSAPFEVRVFRNETRLGYAGNFLRAASLCRGCLIAFCDQDDIWMEHKLATCSQFFANTEVLLTIHSSKIQIGDSIQNVPYPYFKDTRLLRVANPIVNLPGFAMMFRSRLLHLVSLAERPQGFNGHDQWVWFLAANVGSIVTIADTLAFYRQHDENVFGAPPQLSVVANLLRVSKTLNYDGFADFEMRCSHVLYQAAEKSPSYATRLRSSAKRLELRSRLHRLRTRIYREDSTPWSRAHAFLGILWNAGYLPDSSKTRLGPRAAVKDLFFGISGVSKCMYSQTQVR